MRPRFLDPNADKKLFMLTFVTGTMLVGAYLQVLQYFL